MSTLLNIEEGFRLLVDKPLEWTSFDVVNKIRYAVCKTIQRKRVKVGHAGTLDPLASGLLLVCAGRKETRNIDSYKGLDKTYEGIIRLGGTTPSYDLESAIDKEFSTEHITEKDIIATTKSFLGEQSQIAPAYSAKKINGTSAYQLARKGEEVHLNAHAIQIKSFDINAIENKDIHFTISCSSGTYIRSIAHDFGKRLHSGAHLAALRRTHIGNYSVENAFNIEDCITHIKTNLAAPNIHT